MRFTAGETMHGHIRNYNDERGFGFIEVAGDPALYWFHATYVTDPIDNIRPGCPVRFDPLDHFGRKRAQNVKIEDKPQRLRKTDFTPDYKGPSVNIEPEKLTDCLKEIANWKLEAKLEDIVKYFCPIPELEFIQSGKRSYVIGRKGTGKTAIVQYLHGREDKKQSIITEKLSFKNFPFNELYNLENASYTRPNQYISIWKYIIYSYAARGMARSKYVDPLIKKRIAKVYPEPDNAGLRNLLGRWTSGDFSISLLGHGFSFANWFKKKEQTSWQERVDHLEEFLKARCDESTYLILFDELDEDYKDMFEKFTSGGYIDLLTSLFKAVQDVRSVMDRAGKKIYPVIFLRDDIYDLITDSDKNKWRDLTTYLEWDLSEIQRLLKFRLSAAAGITAESFNEVWYSIFDEHSVPYAGRRKSLHSFDFITRSTQGRPRDFIHYLQVCAENQIEKGGGKIEKSTIQNADKAYSNYLRSELVDEIHGLVSDINQIFRLFTQIRKWIISIDEFRTMYSKYADRGIIKTKDADFVLQTLFYFSVIGNVSRQHQIHIFRHENPEAVLNFHENIVIHRGLMKALQIF